MSVRDTVDNPPMYFDRTGAPISCAQWVAYYEGDTVDGRMSYRRVAESYPGLQAWVTGWRRTESGAYERAYSYGCGGCWVSTVWLGIDHGWGHSAQPLIFETMIFGGPRADEQYRTATEAEALETHARLVRELR